jgi:hypothetical protein
VLRELARALGRQRDTVQAAKAELAEANTFLIQPPKSR